MQIAGDKKLTDDQKTEKLAKLMSAPNSCSLGYRHPPNGIEFGVGCSMCEESKMLESKARAIRSARWLSSQS